MRRNTTLCVAADMCALSGVATRGAAQQRSPHQQEVLQHIQVCWDAWTTGDYDRWAGACRPVEGSTYRATTQGATYGLDYWRKVVAARSTQLQYLRNEKRPVAIQIDRLVAIVHFYSLWATVDEGRRVVVEEKRREVFRKADGRWHLVAGMSVPTHTPRP